ncbi:MAG: hypothetical protein KIH67_004610 [Candidatus Moranbacteria bacterium]|nr:hypothetical protein [Candidatus Moranbacteria bacterium]
MGANDFNYTKCTRAFKKLGFFIEHCRKHDKFIAPNSLKILAGPGFIMVPRHSKLHCQNAIKKELKVMGGERLLENFLKYI